MSCFDTYPEWPPGLGDPRVWRSDKEDNLTKKSVLTADNYRTFASNRFLLRCRGDIATKQCQSCAKYDESQLGFYCDACFTARHPDHRLPHSWTPVKDTTNQEEEWVAHVARHHLEQDAAEVKLLLFDTQAFLAKLLPQNSTAPPGPDTINFKKTYETTASIQNTLRDLLKQIHEQLEQKSPLTREEALAKIQSMWKIRKARKQLKALIRDVYTSFADPATGQTYYYNKYTKKTQWAKPIALGNESLADKTVRAAVQKPKSTIAFASREERECYAVCKLQSMARTHFARRHMRKLISSVYEKIWDTNSTRFYYHNTRTKEVKWDKPLWVSDRDLLTPRTRHAQQQLEPVEQARNSATTKRNRRTESLTAEEAARKLQSMARSHFARRHLTRLISSVYEKIWDVDTQRFYYHNTNTKEVKWEKPRWVSDDDLLTPRTRFALVHRETQRKAEEIRHRKEPLTLDEAVHKLQSMARCHFARRRMRMLISSVYEKIWDVDTQQFYYHNTRTGDVKWEQPRWVSDEDLPTPRTRLRQRQEAAVFDNKIGVKLGRDLLTAEEAACMVQRAFRRKIGFQNLLRLCCAVYERIYDPEQGLYFYHNTRTKETSWDKPLLLRDAKIDVFTPRTRQQKLRSLLAVMKKKTARPIRHWTEEQAATRLQGLYRAKKAKEELNSRLAIRFKQAVDPSSGQVYYIDMQTQEVSWDPPTLLLRSNAQIDMFE